MIGDGSVGEFLNPESVVAGQYAQNFATLDTIANVSDLLGGKVDAFRGLKQSLRRKVVPGKHIKSSSPATNGTSRYFPASCLGKTSAENIPPLRNPNEITRDDPFE